MDELLQLSPAERILVEQTLWDSVSDDEDGWQLTDEQKVTLDQRLAASRKYPTEGYTWDQVKAKFRIS
ncbi:MAG: addiction module protein [Phycisphaeraceae bacterium]